MSTQQSESKNARSKKKVRSGRESATDKKILKEKRKKRKGSLCGRRAWRHRTRGYSPGVQKGKVKLDSSALVSGNRDKLDKLGKMYGLNSLYSYHELEKCIEKEQVDAVYIAVRQTGTRHSSRTTYALIPWAY